MGQEAPPFGRKEVCETLKTTALPPKKKCYLEHRQSSVRSRQFKNVQIIFNNGFCTYDAILRDISEEGARIETKHTLDIPNVFTLKFTHDETTKQCSIVWRDQRLVGVRFVST